SEVSKLLSLEEELALTVTRALVQSGGVFDWFAWATAFVILSGLFTSARSGSNICGSVIVFCARAAGVVPRSVPATVRKTKAPNRVIAAPEARSLRLDLDGLSRREGHRHLLTQDLDDIVARRQWRARRTAENRLDYGAVFTEYALTDVAADDADDARFEHLALAALDLDVLPQRLAEGDGKGRRQDGQPRVRRHDRAD